MFNKAEPRGNFPLTESWSGNLGIKVALLVFIPPGLILFSCKESNPLPSNSDTSRTNTYTAFRNPQMVTIFVCEEDAMEPFISRDGA